MFLNRGQSQLSNGVWHAFGAFFRNTNLFGQYMGQLAWTLLDTGLTEKYYSWTCEHCFLSLFPAVKRSEMHDSRNTGVHISALF